MDASNDTPPAGKPTAPSTGGGSASAEPLSRSAAVAAAEDSQRRLVALSLLFCPGGR